MLASSRTPRSGDPGSILPVLAMSYGAYFVYILASRKHGTLYIGVTNDLLRRVHQHKLKLIDGFTKDYGVDRLVYYEPFDDPASAIAREKQADRKGQSRLGRPVANAVMMRIDREYGSRLSRVLRTARPG
jgi:predicted GIY-YIG superfamily endonuclease